MSRDDGSKLSDLSGEGRRDAEIDPRARCGEDAALRFLQNLVLTGAIRPRSEELRKTLLAARPRKTDGF